MAAQRIGRQWKDQGSRKDPSICSWAPDWGRGPDPVPQEGRSLNSDAEESRERPAGRSTNINTINIEWDLVQGGFYN